MGPTEVLQGGRHSGRIDGPEHPELLQLKRQIEEHPHGRLLDECFQLAGNSVGLCGGERDVLGGQGGHVEHISGETVVPSSVPWFESTDLAGR
jgi:hypothetical protein